MRDLRTATLPSVLTEYCPEFDFLPIKATGCSDETPRATKKRTNNKSVKQQNKQKTPLPRSNTPGSAKYSGKVRKDERERQERVADSWDLARSELLQERHEQLSQKILLQHALIKSQAELSQELRRQEEEKRNKKRSEDLYSKHARENALEAKCKESIDVDRKAKRKSNKANSSQEIVASDTDGASTSPSTSSPISPMGGEHRMRKTGAHSHSGYLPSSEYSSTLPQSPMRELEDEDDYTDDDGGRGSKGEVVTPADLSQVPWHHAQLYRMYGRNADYYIHPKMQPEQKKIVHPTLKSQKGHMGASHIWNTLRTDSKNKLFRSDGRFPQELKDAFSAHVRDGINNQKKPVYRNFTVKDDVPDLNRLMDQSLLRRVAVLKHKTELMYRSSQTNNDRTKVLLFNSPLPAVNEGDEGIGKYLPSWTDDASDISEASYMKWMDEEKKMELRRLKAMKKCKTIDEEYQLDKEGDDVDTEDNDVDDENKPPAPTQQPQPVTAASIKPCHPKSVLSPVPSTTSQGLQTIWHKVMARQKPRKEPRYHFLTEDEARVDGAFLEKLGLEKDRIDRGRVDLLSMRDSRPSRGSLPGSLKSMSALETRRSFASGAGSGNARSESAQNSSSRFQSSWQPLSMHALIEYKEQMGTQGRGEFQQGRPRMWSTANPNHTAVEQQ